MIDIILDRLVTLVCYIVFVFFVLSVRVHVQVIFLLIVLYGVTYRLLDRTTHKVMLGRESHEVLMTQKSFKNSSIL